MTYFFINGASWGYVAETASRIAVVPTARPEASSGRVAAGVVTLRPALVSVEPLGRSIGPRR